MGRGIWLFRLKAGRQWRLLTRSRSRGTICPRFASNILPQRGSRDAGCALHPRSRVQNCAKNAHTSIQVQRKHSGIPLRNGFTAYGALSSATNSFCHRRRRIEGLRPGWTVFATSALDTSNGCRNHTLLPYASAPFVCAPVDRSRKPALRSALARRRCRVHRIPPRVRDDRDTPLLSGETGKLIEVICRDQRNIYKRTDTDMNGPKLICPSGRKWQGG